MDTGVLMTHKQTSLQYYVETATEHLWYIYQPDLFGGKPTTTPIGCMITESRLEVKPRDWVGEDEPEESLHWCFTLVIGEHIRYVEIDTLDGYDGDEDAWLEGDSLISSGDSPFSIGVDCCVTIVPAERF